MAAKRIGAALTNITGSASQILRVKSDESGFEYYTPASIPDYTITNDSTLRTLDANSTDLDELANIVSTLIKDLKSCILGQTSVETTFQWSTTEQLCPFIKGPAGETCYAKMITATITSSTPSISHSTAFVKMLLCDGFLFDVTEHAPVPIMFSHPAGYAYATEFNITTTALNLWIGSGWGSMAGGKTIRFYLIYTKS